MRYRTTVSRAGWALALGGASIGSGVALLAWAGGDTGSLGVLGLWLLGSAVGVAVIAGLGGPLWWLTQRLLGRGGRRGPIAAGITGAAVGGVAALAVLTRGFGAGLPVADGATLTAIWSSAGAMAAVAAFLGGLIALAMWLVSYRPDGQ